MASNSLSAEQVTQEVKQQTPAPPEVQTTKPSNPQEALLSAIKNGQFQLRKTATKPKGKATSHSAVDGSELWQEALSNTG